jgi:hypothetical protein
MPRGVSRDRVIKSFVYTEPTKKALERIKKRHSLPSDTAVIKVALALLDSKPRTDAWKILRGLAADESS